MEDLFGPPLTDDNQFGDFGSDPYNDDPSFLFDISPDDPSHLGDDTFFGTLPSTPTPTTPFPDTAPLFDFEPDDEWVSPIPPIGPERVFVLEELSPLDARSADRDIPSRTATRCDLSGFFLTTFIAAGNTNNAKISFEAVSQSPPPTPSPSVWGPNVEARGTPDVTTSLRVTFKMFWSSSELIERGATHFAVWAIPYSISDQPYPVGVVKLESDMYDKALTITMDADAIRRAASNAELYDASGGTRVSAETASSLLGCSETIHELARHRGAMWLIRDTIACAAIRLASLVSLGVTEPHVPLLTARQTTEHYNSIRNGTYLEGWAAQLLQRFMSPEYPFRITVPVHQQPFDTSVLFQMKPTKSGGVEDNDDAILMAAFYSGLPLMQQMLRRTQLRNKHANLFPYLRLFDDSDDPFMTIQSTPHLSPHSNEPTIDVREDIDTDARHRCATFFVAWASEAERVFTVMRQYYAVKRFEADYERMDDRDKQAMSEWRRISQLPPMRQAGTTKLRNAVLNFLDGFEARILRWDLHYDHTALPKAESELAFGHATPESGYREAPKLLSDRARCSTFTAMEMFLGKRFTQKSSKSNYSYLLTPAELRGNTECLRTSVNEELPPRERCPEIDEANPIKFERLFMDIRVIMGMAWFGWNKNSDLEQFERAKSKTENAQLSQSGLNYNIRTIVPQHVSCILKQDEDTEDPGLLDADQRSYNGNPSISCYVVSRSPDANPVKRVWPKRYSSFDQYRVKPSLLWQGPCDYHALQVSMDFVLDQNGDKVYRNTQRRRVWSSTFPIGASSNVHLPYTQKGGGIGTFNVGKIPKELYTDGEESTFKHAKLDAISLPTIDMMENNSAGLRITNKACDHHTLTMGTRHNLAELIQYLARHEKSTLQRVSAGIGLETSCDHTTIVALRRAVLSGSLCALPLFDKDYVVARIRTELAALVATDPVPEAAARELATSAEWSITKSSIQLFVMGTMLSSARFSNQLSSLSSDALALMFALNTQRRNSISAQAYDLAKLAGTLETDLDAEDHESEIYAYSKVLRFRAEKEKNARDVVKKMFHTAVFTTTQVRCELHPSDGPDNEYAAVDLFEAGGFADKTLIPDLLSGRYSYHAALMSRFISSGTDARISSPVVLPMRYPAPDQTNPNVELSLVKRGLNTLGWSGVPDVQLHAAPQPNAKATKIFNDTLLGSDPPHFSRASGESEFYQKYVKPGLYRRPGVNEIENAANASKEEEETLSPDADGSTDTSSDEDSASEQSSSAEEEENEGLESPRSPPQPPTTVSDMDVLDALMEGHVQHLEDLTTVMAESVQ